MIKKKIPLHSLVILIGGAKSGKTTFAQQHFDNYEIISSDNIQVELCGSLERTDIGNDVFDEIRRRVHTKLMLGERAVVDHTNLRRWERTKIAQIGEDIGVAVFYVVVERPLDEKIAASPSEEWYITKQHDYFIQSQETILQGDGVAEVIDTREDTVNVVKKLPIGNVYNFIKQNGYNGITVIPDVHGTLQSLKNAVNWAQSGGRWIVFLGDIIDYGPKSLDCIDLVYELLIDGAAGMVLGNHETKIYRWLTDTRDKNIKINDGNQVTIDALNKKETNDRRKWINKFKTVVALGRYNIEVNNIMFSHAGCNPEWWGLNKQLLSGWNKSLALFGEMDKNEPFSEGKPNRIYSWIDNIPADKISIVGHDIRQTNMPLTVENENKGKVIFMDTGSGKGGKLSTADIRFGKSHQLSVTNFNQF